MYAYNITQATKELSSIVNSIVTNKTPAIIMKEGEPIVTINPIDEDKLEDFALANASEFVADPKAAEKEIAAGGRGISHAELVEKLNKEWGNDRV